MEQGHSREKEGSREQGHSREEILRVQGLKKTFRLSSKQQKIEKTNEKLKVAVNQLSFTAYRGEVFPAPLAPSSDTSSPSFTDNPGSGRSA